MHKLSAEEIVKRIHKGDTFEAQCQDGSFDIKIVDYLPYVGAAIHAGSRLRDSLRLYMALSDFERWYEEDPYTDEFIAALPIVINARDSRFAYDLNRAPELAVYEDAWGKQVWKEPLPSEEKEESLRLHQQFYQVIYALIEHLESRYGGCLVFDVHSYNYRRWDRMVPLFNLGTINLDNQKYSRYIEYFRKELLKIQLPNIENQTAINDVFQGNGYLLRYITEHFANTLVLATEIKKVYVDERNGESYPMVIAGLQEALKKAILNTASFFTKLKTNLKVVKKHQLLSSELDQNILELDKRLFAIARNFEVLNYINPANIESERKRFTSARYKVNPRFRYRQISVDPFEFKRKLYQLPVEKIRDINIQTLYKDVISAYSDKADILATIGTDKFMYNSLRYFGEPDERDLANARYLLYAPEYPSSAQEDRVQDVDVKAVFERMARKYGFECKIEITPNIVSKVLVLNNKKLVRIKRGAHFSAQSVEALAQHEIGVHMLTTVNARRQPLQLMRLGLPINTLTQEGLAVLSEYLSGNMGIKRLKELALRVIAVYMMRQGYEFVHIFEFLVDEGKMDITEAFYLAARVFRGGGFTKDYLYLRGFRDVWHYFKSGKSLTNLLIGKTSLDYVDILKEMIDRRIILPPKYKTSVFENPANGHDTLNYVISGIR